MERLVRMTPVRVHTRELTFIIISVFREQVAHYHGSTGSCGALSTSVVVGLCVVGCL